MEYQDGRTAHWSVQCTITQHQLLSWNWKIILKNTLTELDDCRHEKQNVKPATAGEFLDSPSVETLNGGRDDNLLHRWDAEESTTWTEPTVMTGSSPMHRIRWIRGEDLNCMQRTSIEDPSAPLDVCEVTYRKCIQMKIWWKWGVGWPKWVMVYLWNSPISVASKHMNTITDCQTKPKSKMKFMVSAIIKNATYFRQFLEFIWRSS